MESECQKEEKERDLGNEKSAIKAEKARKGMEGRWDEWNK